MTHPFLLDSRATNDDRQENEELDECQHEPAAQQDDVMLAIPVLDFVKAALQWERNDKNELCNEKKISFLRGKFAIFFLHTRENSKKSCA